MGPKEYKLFSLIKPNRLFDSIPESELSFKINPKDFVDYSEGDIIFQSGEPADIVYLLLEGRVKIKHNASVDGQRYFEKTDQEFFGEKEFIQGTQRTSSAVADTDIKVFTLHKDVVNELISKNKTLLHNLQAIDPTKDVARFGMTTAFQSDEFDALMRSVRQSTSDGFAATKESSYIPPVDDEKTDFEIIPPLDDKKSDFEFIPMEPISEDLFPPYTPENERYNPKLSMEILDPSEGSSYKITDHTFTPDDENIGYHNNETGTDSKKPFLINPDLFTQSKSKPGSKPDKKPEDDFTGFSGFESLHTEENKIPDGSESFPMPENNIYDDVYGTGDTPVLPPPENTAGAHPVLPFDMDFSAFPDDDDIKREGSLEDYVPTEQEDTPANESDNWNFGSSEELEKEKPASSQKQNNTKLPFDDMQAINNLFAENNLEGLPENFTRSLLNSEFISKTPEELEAIIRSASMPIIPSDDSSPTVASPETQGTEQEADPFSWDIRDTTNPPDEGAEEKAELMDKLHEQIHLNIPESFENTEDSAEQSFSGFHLHLPDDDILDTNTQKEFIPAEPESPDFSLNLPHDFANTDISESEAQPETPKSENEFGGFHLSLPGDTEDHSKTYDDTLSETGEKHGLPESFHLNLPGDDASPMTNDEDVQVSGKNDSFSFGSLSETGNLTEEEDTPVDEIEKDWEKWSFEKEDDIISFDDAEVSSAKSQSTTEQSADDNEFEQWGSDNTGGGAGNADKDFIESAKPAGSLISNLFGKPHSPEGNANIDHVDGTVSDDNQSGEYIWDFEKSEFVKVFPDSNAEAFNSLPLESALKEPAPTEDKEEINSLPNKFGVTGEIRTSDFLWDTEKGEFVELTSASPVSQEISGIEPNETEANAEAQTEEITDSAETDFWGSESLADDEQVSSSKEPDSPLIPKQTEFETEPHIPTDFADSFAAQDDDINILPRDFASGNFNFGDDSQATFGELPSTEEIAESVPIVDEPIEGEGESLWDFSEDDGQPITETQTPEQTPTPPEVIDTQIKSDNKFPSFNFLEEGGGIIQPEDLTSALLPSGENLNNLKDWIDSASDKDLMSLLSNMGEAFNNLDPGAKDTGTSAGSEPVQKFDDGQSLQHFDNLYENNLGGKKDTMENNSNYDQKKSLRSLFKTSSEQSPQPVKSSEPENVFDDSDSVWGSLNDSPEQEGFLQEDSRHQADFDLTSSEKDSKNEMLGSEFEHESDEKKATFVKKNEPGYHSPLKQQKTLESVQLSTRSEEGLSVEQLRLIIEAAKTVNSNIKLEEALKSIVVAASNLTKADRGTLYIIDRDTDELWSKVIKGEQIEEIRLRIGQGIAGSVARSGEILNLKNAYTDKRFDPHFDSITGYKTTSMLCYPIKDRHGNINAVLQLLNSAQGYFSRLDEEMMGALSSFIALSIENAELAENMVQGDRLTSLGKVANFIISDIKKPILTIKHLAEHLRTKKDLPREVRSVLKMILDQSIIVGDLILTTLNFSQGKVMLNKKLLKVNAVLDEILGMLQESFEYKKVQILKKYDRDVFVMVDRKELYQAFFQITKNACDAMPGGGELQISTKIVEDDGTIEISFKDAGMGIPESIKEKLFEPFFSQGKKNGIGLGLPITEKIIREHGGSITVESELGNGANFVVTLPQVTKVG